MQPDTAQDTHSAPLSPTNGALPERWSRVVIVSVEPSVEGGRWPVKRSVGEDVEVVAGVIIDGHDRLAVELRYRHEDDAEDQAVRLALRYNDEYVGRFSVDRLGRYHYQVHAWVDQFGTWQDQFRRRVEGGEADSILKSELLDGAALLRRAAEQAEGRAARQLRDYAEAFEDGEIAEALDDHVVALARDHDPREGVVESRTFEVVVDPELARFGAWYEFFPRSAADEEGVHGTLDDAAARLPRIKELGFDVVYLPPIHPIGVEFRKGKDNAPTAEPGEPGSPWAIGGDQGDGTLGGHKSVHPELGGLDAFDRFVAKADEVGLKVALDVAFQTSPNHPYVEQHPEWFRHRPDGTIRYAENPPKKYQDVYPFDFEGEAWPALWEELKSVFEFWIDHGVRIFRVDNPHTKPFAFWQWCLAELRRDHPDLIFLAEAFARPKIMYTLAKLGFNNSYTYFAWRNTKQEIEEYATELAGEVGEFFRPNFWPNTPDILTEYLVHGGRPAHVVRFILAATLSSVYGIYGPPYEHVVNKQHPKREEYADNEKYEIRTWNWNDPGSLQPLMRRINKIRRENPALHFWRNVRFHPCDNPNIVAYSKQHGDNLILCTVSLNPFQAEAGWIHLPLGDWDLHEGEPFEVQDLLRGEYYFWHSAANYVHLEPHVMPAHIFRIRRQRRSEQDFEYFA